jgi:5-methylthioribose kinase
MPDLLLLLRNMNLIGPGESPVVTALAGGVSSEIFHVDAARGPFCVKRALAKLRVSADWNAPVERNQHEVGWLKLAASVAPGMVPRVLAERAQDGIFAMEFLPPENYPVWKALLRDGDINPDIAAAVGALTARVHAATAADPAVAARFATDAIFHALRLEPYLLATARAHPDCAAALEALAARTASTRLALVHGDVSPKNILVGGGGPVLLDAECAWYGDPAFDLAFCLTHLLLKSVWRPQWRLAYLACFDALKDSYLRAVSWEQPAAIEQRAAQLLPGLLLARIAGKSPVEYIVSDSDRNYVRSRAITLLQRPPSRLAAVRAAWT